VDDKKVKQNLGCCIDWACS